MRSQRGCSCHIRSRWCRGIGRRLTQWSLRLGLGSSRLNVRAMTLLRTREMPVVIRCGRDGLEIHRNNNDVGRPPPDDIDFRDQPWPDGVTDGVPSRCATADGSANPRTDQSSSTPITSAPLRCCRTRSGTAGQTLASKDRVATPTVSPRVEKWCSSDTCSAIYSANCGGRSLQSNANKKSNYTTSWGPRISARVGTDKNLTSIVSTSASAGVDWDRTWHHCPRAWGEGRGAWGEGRGA